MILILILIFFISQVYNACNLIDQANWTKVQSEHVKLKWLTSTISRLLLGYYGHSFLESETLHIRSMHAMDALPEVI